MKYSIDIKMTIAQKAKHLLLGHSCDNCYYHDNPYRPASVFCIRNSYPDFGDSPGAFIDFVVKEGICNRYCNANIPLKKRLLIDHKCRGEQLTQHIVDVIVNILENKNDIV